MSELKKPVLALLQWIGGDYDQSYTAGVPIDWILNFDSETFDPAEEISYVVEWRENKRNKKPKKGYKHYDARVVKISRSLKSLEKQAEILDGLMSPLRPERTLEAIKNNFKNSTKRRLENELNDPEFSQSGNSESGIKKLRINSDDKRNKPMDDGKANGAGDGDGDGAGDRHGDGNDNGHDDRAGDRHGDGNGDGHGDRDGDGHDDGADDRHGDGNGNRHGDRDGDGHDDGADDRHGNGNGNGHGERDGDGHDDGAGDQHGDGHHDNPDLAAGDPEVNGDEGIGLNQQIHRDNQFIKRTLNTLVTEIRSLREAPAAIIQDHGDIRNRQQDPNDQVEIGRAGSNIFIRRSQWDTANSRDTFQGMGRSLVRALFSDEVLLRSNYRGGVSKVDKNAPNRPGLDSATMAAIKETVKEKFSAEFKQTLFGMAINNMMTDMRRKNKVAQEVEVDAEIH